MSESNAAYLYKVVKDQACGCFWSSQDLVQKK